MEMNTKAKLVAEIQALEEEGKALAAVDWDYMPGESSAHTEAVADQHVRVTAKRRELAALIRHEAGMYQQQENG